MQIFEQNNEGYRITLKRIPNRHEPWKLSQSVSFEDFTSCNASKRGGTTSFQDKTHISHLKKYQFKFQTRENNQRANVPESLRQCLKGDTSMTSCKSGVFYNILSVLVHNYLAIPKGVCTYTHILTNSRQKIDFQN